jgi:hypothetical protein
MANQLTTASTWRLHRCLGMLGKADIDAVSRAIRLQLDL